MSRFYKKKAIARPKESAPLWASFSVFPLKSKFTLFLHAVDRDLNKALDKSLARIDKLKNPHNKRERHKMMMLDINRPHNEISEEAGSILKDHGFDADDIDQLKITLFVQITSLMESILKGKT
jgi:hypothetical protein